MPANSNDLQRVHDYSATGGAATGDGVLYQLRYSVYQALRVIQRALFFPERNLSITVEPREIGNATVARWDLKLAAPDLLIEVKLRPSREDITRWINQVLGDARSPGPRSYRLAYGSGTSPLLASLKQLQRLAHQAHGSKSRLSEIVALESKSRDLDLVLHLIADLPIERLRQIEVHHVPPESLEENLASIAESLAGPKASQQLADFLLARFVEAMPNRRQFHLIELIAEIRAAGIPLTAPPSFALADETKEVAQCLIGLQVCSAAPVPSTVLAEAAGCAPAHLETQLQSFIEEGVVRLQGDAYFLTPRPARLSHPDEAAYLATTLSALAQYVARVRLPKAAQPHIRNVRLLAEACLRLRPEAVVQLFSLLDKTLKDLGDRHEVLEIANLSIAASRAIPGRSADIADAEARALICGVCWVYQRINRVHEARAAAQRSLQLAKGVGLPLTAAFASKCMGRLSRIEAELQGPGTDRDSRLAESIELLNAAVRQFSQLEGFGPEDAEVGDCYSLLGRTYLVRGDLGTAGTYVKQAYRRLAEGTKDYLDLLILEAELKAKSREEENAATIYDEAVTAAEQAFPQQSEMLARALFARGLNLLTLAREPEALSSFQRAQRIWEGLGEEYLADGAEWQAVCLEAGLSSEVIATLAAEPIGVRVRSARIHLQRSMAVSERTLHRRSEQSQAYWREILQRARRDAALEDTVW